MIPGIQHIVLQSIRFYRKPLIFQVLIIALLSAVITGSLLTGTSVEASLQQSAGERLGNTGFMISSGVRYFDSSVAERMKDNTGINSVGILEKSGYCQGLTSQRGAYNVHIFGVKNDFFKFHGNDSVIIKQGEVVINKKLADYLDLRRGDDLIIQFEAISDIPADAPFAPHEKSDYSVVMKVGSIIDPGRTGNFSLSISQIVPMNIFINLSEIAGNERNTTKVNRLLIEKQNDLSLNSISRSFKQILLPEDIGLRIRQVKKTGQIEITSDRVFIDDFVIKEISLAIPSSAPVITYLGNRFKSDEKVTPYSFIAGLPSSVYPEIPDGKGIIINKWLAEDLNVVAGDSIQIYWYSPDVLNKLIESSSWFRIKQIVKSDGIWSDSLLMPDFPGISGSESCSDWDAGVPIKMNEIRRKDEDYWNKYRGTPKAFINYETAKKMWGNNFGPATSIRFPEDITEKYIKTKLQGNLDPEKSGFTVNDLSGSYFKAANESVDFGTLFLSLGFFLILSSVVLLSFSVSSYFESKRRQISTLFALGFKSRWIQKILFIESGAMVLAGSFLGALLGYLVNIVITGALNSVWKGATQTETLGTFFSLITVLTGFLITVILMMLFMFLKVNSYLKMLNRKGKKLLVNIHKRRNIYFLLVSSFIAFTLFAFSIILKDLKVSFYFGTGTFLLITMVLLWRQYLIGWSDHKKYDLKNTNGLSYLYYSFYPSHAVTPVLFIASGIFAVFIAGANKMNYNENNIMRSDGTGGYLLWCENTIPVKEDLNSPAGRKALGLDTEQLAKMSFVQMKRSSGDDASCLNLNHVTSPSLLGLDPTDFIEKGSFSFSRSLKVNGIRNPWQFLNIASEKNTIYGIGDQTVLEWGLKLQPGDSLIMRAENGQPLYIIIAAGLKSSVFQGHVLIGLKNFRKYYPSVSGSSVLLIDGDKLQTNSYKNILDERLSSYGINTEKTTERLKSFNEVTNTYLSVFGVFGALGMIIGIAGLGFVLLRNYGQRKGEFAIMLAIGFSMRMIRKMILTEQIKILFAGVFSGLISAIVATFPSIKGSPDIPWVFLFVMVFSITTTGLFALLLSVRAVSGESLTASLKKD